ncbi:MAG TPA: AAA family ATPase [Solirubrobacteraceae bacterium]|nr:AAA family ATPase [Solirubrobacteraceae bacterium]
MPGRAEGLEPGRLLERTEELARIDQLLDTARTGTGALLVVSGPAGIGKTSLLAACADGAVKRAMTTFSVRGDELAMESSFSAVRELFAHTHREDGGRLFDGAARLAEPVFAPTRGEGTEPDRVAGVLHGLYWLVANLGDRGPLTLIVDDAQWLDAASTRFLLYLARRVESLPVLMAVAIRPGEGPGPGGSMVMLSELAAAVLQPAPLTEASSGKLVRGRLGPRADEDLCRSCHQATGGNPFYLRELAMALGAERVRPTVELAGRVRELGAAAIARSVIVRLARLGSDCERLAGAVAVLAPGSPLRHGAELAGLDHERAQLAADRLRAVELLDPGQALSFVHPIVREAVAAQLSPSHRAALHLAAARMLYGEDATTDRVAPHLLSAEPFGAAWVVEALQRAAGEALGQGAPEAASAYLHRALAEPPEHEHRLEILIELGRAEALLPAKHDFAALRQAVTLAGDPARRAGIALELAGALASIGRFCEVVVVLEGVLDAGDELPPEMTERLEALLLGGGGPCLSAVSRLRERMTRHLQRAEQGVAVDPVMLAALAQSFGIAGLPAVKMARLAQRALEDPRLREFTLAYTGASVALAWADHFELAAHVQDAAIAEAQRIGSAPLFMHCSCFRSETAVRAGALAVAEGQLEPVQEIASELGADHFAGVFLVPVLLERARVEEAARLVSSVVFTETTLGTWPGVMSLVNRGRVRIARGDAEAGVADLLDADRRMRAGGCDLSVLSDWVATAAIALEELGRHDEAIALASRELAAAHAFGAARRLGVALSTAGLLDSGARGLELLSDAVKVLEPSPARLEHARALVNLGAGLRQRGQREAARRPLAEGSDHAHRCGGVALADRARTELLAAGARPRRSSLRGPDALTPAELRVARMAAQGLTNREIAQALFVSTKTVEWQLSRAYQKLAVRSRTQLHSALKSTD